MGYYDKTDASTATEGIWFKPDAYDFSKCYNACEAFEQALLNTVTGDVVGKVLTGFMTFPPAGLKPFGIEYRVRRIGDPEVIKDKKIAKRKADAERRKAAKSYESVITLTFDREWSLTGKTVESRRVYTNTKGQHIKTRSNGSPRVHEIDGKFVVVYYPHPLKNGRGDINYRLKAASTIPDECPVLDNI